MEGLPVVCYSTGTMNSVLDKLTTLKNHSNTTDEFSVLTESLKINLQKLKEDSCDKISGQRATHMQVKVSMKQVRELVFNIDDWIDQKPEANMEDPSHTEKIEHFNSKIHRARERFTWYFDLLRIVSTEADAAPSRITINPRLAVEEKPCHGLLDGPRDELVKHLTDENEDMRKVVSVIGKEGLGKTTLAKEIYSELQLCPLFECRAFVSVGRRPAMREILSSILRQVNPAGSWISLDMVSAELREYLSTKRYFIVVDGIWSTWAWKVINCVLPNNRGSRVMTTSCIMDVGRSCCSYPTDLVYQMEALSKENSRILFLSRITRQKERVSDFEEVCGDMLLNICGGMPLAISVAADLFARKSEEQAKLNMLGKFMLSSLDQYSTFDGVTMILQMNYDDLSLPLRSCFLYLSVFPDNYTIKKDRLIRLWGAEGFIPIIDEECLWVRGEMFFNELICRRLIQPVFNFDDDQAVGCTVHSFILDFIRSLSREENFATRATELNSSQFPCGTIRRYSLDCRNKDEAVSLSTSIAHLSSVRSLTVFGDVEGKLDPPAGDEQISEPSVSKHGEETGAPPVIRVSTDMLSHFKLLRVLDLEYTMNLENEHLEGIGGLVLLRYLGLAGTGITKLPEDITKLEQLETLDLRWNDIENSPAPMVELPGDVFNLPKLRHLLLEVEPAQIWEMPELEAASDIHVTSRRSLVKVVELLRKSERLRMLGVHMETLITTQTDLMSFLNEVLKSKLQSLSLSLCSYFGEETLTLLVDSWEKVTASLEKNFVPQRFELRATDYFSKRLPPNMGSLVSLTHLHINLDEEKAEDFLLLGELTNLVLLNLTSLDGSGRLLIRKGIFPCLKVFSFLIEHSWMGLEFEEGAMPQLQRLGRMLGASERGDQGYPDIGIEHLSCLTRVHTTINCFNATVLEVEATEAAIRAQVSEIATKPTFELTRENEDYMREEQRRHSLLVPTRTQVSEKADEYTLESSTEHQVQMPKDEGKQSIPFEKHFLPTPWNSSYGGALSEDKMKKDPEEVSEKTEKHNSELSSLSLKNMKNDQEI